MTGWRDELAEAVKSREEREAEQAERRRQRIQEALAVADDAMGQALDALRFARRQLEAKGQAVRLGEEADQYRFELGELTLVVALDRETATLESVYNDGKPRQFEFAKDRHLSPKDIEEYVGRRLVELARTAQKENPW